MKESVLIVGSGICGMCTAISLADQGYPVTLLERDEPPPAMDPDQAFFQWPRRGAAQFRHPHAFLGLMCNLIEDNYPELLDRFCAAGARRVGFDEMIPPELRTRYQPEPGDEELWVLLCRRATIETVIRQYVTELPGVELRSRVQITGIEAAEDDSGPLRITGLQARSGAETFTARADIVIDASGRTSRFPGWFAELGRTVPEESADAEIVYYTRHYRLKPGQVEPARGERQGAGDLGYLKYGVFPGDNGHFAIILCLPVQEEALKRAVRDARQFDAICSAIPGLELWVQPERSEGTTEPFGIGDIRAVWRDFVVAEQPLALNFFAVGDAALRTNPLYGRGCSTGIMHANLLATVLTETVDPVARARRFHQLTQEHLRPIYEASLNEDRSGIRRADAIRSGRALNRAGSFKKWFTLAFGDALSAASRNDLYVLRGVMRTFHLLEKPGDFLQDARIRRKIFRYMLRGRRRNAATRLQPGPDRGTMHRLLSLPAA